MVYACEVVREPSLDSKSSPTKAMVNCSHWMKRVQYDHEPFSCDQIGSIGAENRFQGQTDHILRTNTGGVSLRGRAYRGLPSRAVKDMPLMRMERQHKKTPCNGMA
jgi:hypothetical protein